MHQRPIQPSGHAPPPEAAAPPPAMLRCANLWKVYGSGADRLRPEGRSPEALAAAGLVVAVRDISLEVAKGEIAVIMGLSGCGKSTLVRCLSRLVEPTSGTVTFEGEDLLAMPKRQLMHLRRHKMGMVFQHFALFPHLTALENVAFPLEMRGVPRAERERRARETLDLVGLAGREGRLPHALSGGQKQRVGIARALIGDPDILFLDEPFSALDPLIRREMQDEFLRLQAQLRKTAVFITHDFDEAARLADRIAIMSEGAFIQVGSPEEIVTRPASDHVAEFTRFVDLAKVVTVGSIMGPPAEEPPGATVPATARVIDIAHGVIGSQAPVGVLDAAARLVGSLDREAVIRVLAGGGAERGRS